MIQEIPYAGWKRNLRIQGPTTELVVTLDVGPRIIRYAFPGEKNVFVEMPEQLGGVGEGDWKIRGGHRLWTAPEGAHSYAPDNAPVEYKKISDKAVEVAEPANKQYGFQKTIRIELLADETAKVTHLLTNATDKALDISPWVLSVMAPGRRGLDPAALPNREMVLWPFTDLSDGRYAFSENFLRVTYQPEMKATKLGLKLPTGWVAYQNGENVLRQAFFL